MSLDKIRIGNLVGDVVIQEDKTFKISIDMTRIHKDFIDIKFADCYDKTEKNLKEDAKTFCFEKVNKRTNSVLFKTTYPIYRIYSEIMVFGPEIEELSDKNDELYRLKIDMANKNLGVVNLFCSNQYGNSYVLGCFSNGLLDMSLLRDGLMIVGRAHKSFSIPYRLGCTKVVSEKEWLMVEDILGEVIKETGTEVMICGYPYDKIN